MSSISFFGCAILLAVSGFLLSSFGWRGVPLLCAIGMLLFFGRITSVLFPSLSELLSRLPDASVSYVSTAVKILCVSYLGSITADVSRDLGSISAERIALVASKAEILFLTLPYFSSILETGLSLL